MALLALGLTVFNRSRLLTYAAASLRPILSDRCRLFVLNDGSTEFSEQDLRNLLPNAVIETNATNSGRADYAAVQLARILLRQDAQFVVMLDSDLMLHASFVDTVLAAMPYTDGLMTALNSDRHKPFPEGRVPLPDINNALIQKTIVGNAGTVWTKELLAEVLQSVPTSSTWDWDYCAHLRNNGKRIFSLERSIVQHLGFWVGQNSSRMNGDWGLGYPSLSAVESSVVAEMLFLGTKSALSRAASESSTKYISAHHFRPLGTMQGRGRVYALQEPFVLEADISFDEGYHYIFVDAKIVRTIDMPFRRGQGTLELSITVKDKVITCSPVDTRRLMGPDGGLSAEFDVETPCHAKIELRFRGAILRHRLQLKGLFVDRV